MEENYLNQIDNLINKYKIDLENYKNKINSNNFS